MPQLSDTYLVNDTNLKGYWKLEDVNDSSSSGYNLTNNGIVTFVPGRFNNAGSFNGSSQWLSNTAANCNLTGNQTWNIWIKPSSITTTQVMMGFAQSGVGGRILYINTDGTVKCNFDGLSAVTITSQNTLTKDAWNFISVSYNGSQSRLFVNGIFTYLTSSGTMTALTSELNIGRRYSYNDLYFTGLIDDVSIFNRALTDQEVLNIYQSNIKKIAGVYMGSQEIAKTSLATDANLQGYWKLESDGSDESSNNNDLTPSGSPTHVSGKFGSCVDVELSSSQYYSIAHASQTNLSQSGSQSFSSWIKQESQGTNQAIVSKRNNADDGWVLYIRDTGQPTIRMDFSGGVQNLSGGVISTGVWNHVTFVFNSSTPILNIFVNGVKSTATPSGTLSTTTTPFAIGCDFSGASDVAALFFDGLIDDTAFFNRALTDAEVFNLYNSGIKKLGGVINVPVELSTLPLASDANLQGYWKLEANGNDSGPNGYNLTGTAPSYVNAKFGNGGDFEADSSQYLSIADASCPNLEISGSKTVSAWVKFETIGVAQIIVSKDGAGGQNPLLYLNSNNLFYFYDVGLTTNTQVISDISASVGNWIHVVGRYNGSTLAIFINGVKKEVSATGSATDSNGVFYVGKNGTGNYFDGIIDDVAIWNRALTDAEVSTLYESQIKKFVGVANR